MRILYDGFIYAEQSRGGINRYFANLIGRLPNTYTPILTSCQGSAQAYPTHPQLRLFSFKRFRPVRLSLKIERAYFGHVQDSERYDVVHPTYYTQLSQREVSQYRRPVVLTVWDMIHERFPDLESTGVMAARKRRAVAAAAAVICISENTKRDLLDHLDIPEEKVIVTHLASELDMSYAHGAEVVPQRAYFLYVGPRASYKNFDSLLFAFSTIRASLPEVSLCVVGPPLTHAELARIAELGLSDRVEHYGDVNDSHLAKLYRCSLALVYPSLYEGFGIPPLEAMSCGTAVVASNRSSIPEVVGDAGLLFDPDSKDELPEILLSLANDPTLRDRLIAKGRARAALFSWEKTINRTLEVYKMVSGLNGLDSHKAYS